MCGIIGIVGHGDIAQGLYDGLTVLQHRGQDAAGIATVDRARLHLHKSNGLVSEVFQVEHMQRLTGSVGIGHCRYPTAGCEGSDEAQPFYVNSPFGIALAHNGNLTNSDALRAALFAEDRRHINTDSDSEVLLNVFAHELQREAGLRIEPDQLFAAVAGVHRRCQGGYAAVALIPGFGLIAFRDPHGIRPLVYGVRDVQGELEYCVASESVALDVLGFRTVRDVAPGEAIFISEDGRLHTRRCAPTIAHTPCIFEYVYLARPDSLIDDVSVHKARLRMGERLAAKVLRERPQHDIDVVIPIPDTSRTAAMALATELEVKYREGFIKNRYIGRTFIMPGQQIRSRSVRRKLNAIDLEFRGKVVLLVDDSIVRGTTSRQIIQMARDAGAAKVYFASAAPPVRYPNVYGIDMPAPQELVAHARSEQQVQEVLGCDWLIYQDLDDLIAACREGNESIEDFDTSCFDGRYVTGLADGYLEGLSQARSDQAKATRRETAGVP